MTNVLIAVPEAVPEIVKVIGVVLVGFAIFSSIYKLIKDERRKQTYKKHQKQLAIKVAKRRANYGKEYKDLDEVFSSSSYKDENLFIKTLLDKPDHIKKLLINMPGISSGATASTIKQAIEITHSNEKKIYSNSSASFIRTLIESHYLKFDGGEIMTKIELHKQMEHIHSVYLKDWKKKKITDFDGFEEVKEHRTIVQLIIPVLEKILQNKIQQI
jgi:hypothetical protein